MKILITLDDDSEVFVESKTYSSLDSGNMTDVRLVLDGQGKRVINLATMRERPGYEPELEALCQIIGREAAFVISKSR